MLFCSVQSQGTQITLTLNHTGESSPKVAIGQVSFRKVQSSCERSRRNRTSSCNYSCTVKTGRFLIPRGWNILRDWGRIRKRLPSAPPSMSSQAPRKLLETDKIHFTFLALSIPFSVGIQLIIARTEKFFKCRIYPRESLAIQSNSFPLEESWGADQPPVTQIKLGSGLE